MSPRRHRREEDEIYDAEARVLQRRSDSRRAEQDEGFTGVFEEDAPLSGLAPWPDWQDVTGMDEVEVPPDLEDESFSWDDVDDFGVEWEIEIACDYEGHT